MRQPTNIPKSFVLLAILLSASAGCSSKPSADVAAVDETENLYKIERAYDAATKRLNRPPADVEQLKPFLREHGDPDTILKSPRDGQPYVIIFNADIRKGFEMPPPIVAHEKAGVNGKRYVLTVMGVVSMSDEEFAKAKFVKPRS